jgi:hypothetical protein
LMESGHVRPCFTWEEIQSLMQLRDCVVLSNQMV